MKWLTAYKTNEHLLKRTYPEIDDKQIIYFCFQFCNECNILLFFYFFKDCISAWVKEAFFLPLQPQKKTKSGMLSLHFTSPSTLKKCITKKLKW